MIFRPAPSLLLATIVASLSPWIVHVAKAHRSIPEGVTCSSQFFSPETALAIPNPTVSWASYRTFTCDKPIFWLEADAVEANQTLHFTATVPVLERFDGVRMSVAFMGPSLPPLTDDGNNDLPVEIKEYLSTTTGSGIVVFKSPQNQTTCDHLTAELMIAESSVVDDRCNFYERFGGSNSWVLLDDTIDVPEAGLYKIAFFVEGGTTAKAAFACCDWPEDFITNYNIPETDCPFCGTSRQENPAWSSLFYEHKDMAQYGGFPPAASCSNPDTQALVPTEGQCPPLTGSTDTETQSASCVLGCNSQGECHSHNALGECTHTLEWDLEPKFGEAPVSNVIIFKGDKIEFGNSGGGSVHNLFQMADQSSFEECNFVGVMAVANVEQILIGHTMTFDEAGTFYFACGISCTSFDGQIPVAPTDEDGFAYDPTLCHCSIGQKLAVEVKDSSEGLRCHDHAQTSKEENASLSCADGEVVVHAINNPSYGAMDETECAELCTQQFAVQFMEGVEMGTCNEKGFSFHSSKKTVTVPGSPQAIEVQVKANMAESTCHCHSYEEIACPEDEMPGDTLYVEHIMEIDEYCKGVLDGSEEICPYKCFQPIEVLHLHYLECPSREMDSMYMAVNTTNLCHIAATAPVGADCPVVTLGEQTVDSPTTSAPTDSPTSSAPTDSPTSSAPTDSPTSSAPTDSPTSSAPTQTWATMVSLFSMAVIPFLLV